MVEFPAVLRFEAQPESVLELARGRGDAWEAHEEARSNHGALLDCHRAALRNIASVQEDLAVEVRRHVELPIGRHRSSEAPCEPTLHAARRELKRRDQRERITRGFLAPQEYRLRMARLRGGESRVRGVELRLPDRAESYPALS